jgi:membrane-bound acyltransferase YfiQ involved in biofilm formation
MQASSLSFQAAVLFVLAGMGWGIQMGITQDHSAFPAHAHLNLLGWVSLFLLGVYYHLNPSLDKAGAARIQVWIWIVGTITETIGVGLVYTGHEAAEPMIAVGSLTLFAAMLIFGWLVFQCERDRRRQRNAILTVK